MVSIISSMLSSLYISNIVLIEKLNLEFGTGLNVLTGETGAGKSILMDALALALGARSDTGLIRHGCETASVTAEFINYPVQINSILQDNGIDVSDTLILRRTLGTDGKSKAWVNDTPVSIKTLKAIGDEVVEIHGQFANHTLLNPATHIAALDTFALNTIDNFADILNETKRTFSQYHSLLLERQKLHDLLEKSALERDFLEHNVAELRNLNPMVGEEEELATKRANMMNAEKNAAILSDAITALNANGNSVDAQICSVAHILERVHGDENPYSDEIDKLYDCAQTIAEISEHIKPENTSDENIDDIEERLFAIRSVARKHRVSADELPNKLAEMQDALNKIDNSDAELQRIESEIKVAHAEFDKYANQLKDLRKSAINELIKQMMDELPDLKLAGAEFMVQHNDTDPSQNGTDDIMFMIKTNPGMPFAPLHKSASGGELSRLMLALRVVLAGNYVGHTFVFDEIDTGISGATASAIGSRLSKLSKSGQSLVITHSAQVAGFADRHFKISKHSDNNKTLTDVVEITGDDRLNEIARIISGAEITSESLAMAKTLLN